AQHQGEFMRDGQPVPAGHGWDWWRKGFAIFMAQPWMWMLVTVGLIGLFLVAGAIVGLVAFGTMRGGSPAAFFAVAGLFGLAMSIVYPVLEAGLMRAA